MEKTPELESCLSGMKIYIELYIIWTLLTISTYGHRVHSTRLEAHILNYRVLYSTMQKPIIL